MERFSGRAFGTDVPAPSGDRAPSEHPIDPGTQGEVAPKRGRRPEEVVESQPQPKPAPKPTDDDLPLAARDKDGDKGSKKPVKKYKYKGEELTADEIVARGLLDEIVPSAEQLPAVQRKHQQVLEKIAERETAAPTQTAEQAARAAEEQRKAYQQHTLQVVKAYEPRAKEEVQFYVANGLIDQDMIDVVGEKNVNTMFSILLYHLDAMNATETKAEGCKQWIGKQIEYRRALEVQAVLNTTVDAVAKRKGRVFQLLRDPDTRNGFINFLRKDADVPTDKIGDEDFIAGQAVAFLSKSMADYIDAEADEEQTRQPDRRRTQSDGTSARIGPVEDEAPKSHLDQMSDAFFQNQ